jgi:hypothetical protein
MTVLLWVGVALAARVILAIALRTLGAARWTELFRTHTLSLESGSAGARERLPSPARLDAHELEGLPPPVQRYFRAVLTDGQPVIAAATIEMTGTMNLSATGEPWKPFTSRPRVITRRPGFLWDAQVFMFPGLPAHVEDSDIAGHGRLIAKVLGLFTVADSQGVGEIARGELVMLPWDCALSDYPAQNGMLIPLAGEAAWMRADGRKAYFVGYVKTLRYSFLP